MDATTRALAEYATTLDAASLPPSVVRATVRHVVDTIGCALGALDARPARAARAIAATATCTFGASVPGLPERTTPEYAAFANAAMVRHLDFNDTGIGGHPSDMIPAILALAEPARSTGRDVVAAIHAAYEVVAGLRRGGLRHCRRHVDQVQSVIGGAVGCGRILGVDRERMAHAVSLALTPNVPLRVTRTGVLSDWKGCAAAHSAMMAVCAARWAGAGLTGPAEPFEGTAGFCELVGAAPFDLRDLGEPKDGLAAVEATGFKAWPAEYSAQGPIGTVLELRGAIDVDAIESIVVAMPWGGWHEIGGGQGDRDAKWDPTTRETADHSLPYLVAVALVDGRVTPESFTAERIADPRLRTLMRRIDVVEDPELTRAHAGELPRWPSTVEIALAGGERIRRRAELPKGHPRNPMSDAELEAKFLGLAARALPAGDARALLDLLWDFERLPDLDALAARLRRCGDAGNG